MILRTKNKYLLIVIVPISPETTEYRGSIIHGVSEHAEFHVGVRNDAALIEDKIWQRHGFTSSISIWRRAQRPGPQSTTRTGSGTGWAWTWNASRLTSPTNAAAK